MRLAFYYMLTIFFVGAHAQAAQRNPVTLPNAPVQTIPADYVSSMNRQEERLDQIDSRMVGIETSLKDFKDETTDSLKGIDTKLDDMAGTNIVMKFVLAIIALVIPTLVGVWFAEYIKNRKTISPPPLPPSLQQ